MMGSDGCANRLNDRASDLEARSESPWPASFSRLGLGETFVPGLCDLK